MNDDIQRHVQTVPDELKIIQLKCEELDLRTRAEENRRQVWEECLEDRLRGADWNTYTEELAAASEEIKAWRRNIEDERANFIALLRSELQDTLLQHIDQKFGQKYAETNGLSDRLVEGTSEEISRLEQRLDQLSTVAGEEIKAWRLNIEDERASFRTLLKSELQDTLLQHIDQKFGHHYAVTNGLPDRVVEGAGEEISRLEQRLDQVSTALHDEIEGLNAILQNEIKVLATKAAECHVEAKEFPDKPESGTDPTVEWTLQQLSMRILELRQDAKAYAMADDVNKLGEQVKESHPLLFDMGVRLTEIENELEQERETRTATTEDLSRRIDLVGTVFNSGKAEKSDKPVACSNDTLDLIERHDRNVKLVLEQVDNMAKSQLNTLREELEQEVIARKGDVELIWRSLNTMKNRRQVPSLSAVPPRLDRRASTGNDEGSLVLSSRVIPQTCRDFAAKPIRTLSTRSMSPPAHIVRLETEGVAKPFPIDSSFTLQHSPLRSHPSNFGSSLQATLGGGSLHVPNGGGSLQTPMGGGYTNFGAPISSPVARSSIIVGDQEGSFSNAAPPQASREYSHERVPSRQRLRQPPNPATSSFPS